MLEFFSPQTRSSATNSQPLRLRLTTLGQSSTEIWTSIPWGFLIHRKWSLTWTQKASVYRCGHTPSWAWSHSPLSMQWKTSSLSCLGWVSTLICYTIATNSNKQPLKKEGDRGGCPLWYTKATNNQLKKKVIGVGVHSDRLHNSDKQPVKKESDRAKKLEGDSSSCELPLIWLSYHAVNFMGLMSQYLIVSFFGLTRVFFLVINNISKLGYSIMEHRESGTN